MTRGSRPAPCGCCDRPIPLYRGAAVALFVNGRGWITACDACADACDPKVVANDNRWAA